MEFDASLSRLIEFCRGRYNLLNKLNRILLALGLFTILLGIGAFLAAIRWYRGNSDSNNRIYDWVVNPDENAALNITSFSRCPNAPFIIPSSGFIGLLWADTAAPYNSLRRHTGLDIFGGGESGTVAVYAVYDGYLSRLDDWRSTVIIRHNDPLQEGRTIWTYYTHMASEDGTSYIDDAFPMGTYNKAISQGTLLGFQGEYNPSFPIATHVHISIVTSEDDGSFKNEAVLENTLDPSPYFGMDLNADTQMLRPVQCLE
jgi:peptidoglycan LD-endopeptidase LytH